MTENDLISRKDAIESIRSMTITIGGNDVFPDNVKSSVLDVLEFAPSIEAEPKWISVEDGPPEENGYYLCWVETSSVGKRKEYEHRKLYWEENLWLSSAKSFKVEHPLYWMPLPEPPKMDGGAEDG